MDVLISQCTCWPHRNLFPTPMCALGPTASNRFLGRSWGQRAPGSPFQECHRGFPEYGALGSLGIHRDLLEELTCSRRAQGPPSLHRQLVVEPIAAHAGNSDLATSLAVNEARRTQYPIPSFCANTQASNGLNLFSEIVAYQVSG